MRTRREPRENSPDALCGDEDPHPWRPTNPAQSFRHAADGILGTVQTQRNMRFHLIALVTICLLGCFFHLTPIEWVLLIGACSLVVVAELFNTAVETVVDMITQEYHPGAKFAKDAGAGAVLVAALNAVAVGAILFLPRISQVSSLLLTPFKPVAVGAAGVLLVLALLAAQRRGLSRSIAAAFFLATAVALLAGDALVAALAVSLALLLTHSRVTARPHTMREVISSVALGLGLALAGAVVPAWFGGGTPPAGEAGDRTPALTRR